MSSSDSIYSNEKCTEFENSNGGDQWSTVGFLKRNCFNIYLRLRIKGGTEEQKRGGVEEVDIDESKEKRALIGQGKKLLKKDVILTILSWG